MRILLSTNIDTTPPRYLPRLRFTPPKRHHVNSSALARTGLITILSSVPSLHFPEARRLDKSLATTSLSRLVLYRFIIANIHPCSTQQRNPSNRSYFPISAIIGNCAYSGHRFIFPFQSATADVIIRDVAKLARHVTCRNLLDRTRSYPLFFLFLPLRFLFSLFLCSSH